MSAAHGQFAALIGELGIDRDQGHRAAPLALGDDVRHDPPGGQGIAHAHRREILSGRLAVQDLGQESIIPCMPPLL